MAGIGDGNPGPQGTTTPPPRTKQPSVAGLDVWAEGQFSFYKDTAANGDRRGSFGILYAGADYCFGQRLLLGFMAQLDWTEETSPAIDSEVRGDGWMVGPYASVKLANALQLDLRGAWGRSSNRAESTVSGAASRFVGDFDSERWLVRGTLSGTWKLAELRMTPEISLAYLQERQDGYTVTDGIDSIAIDAQRLSIGRFSLKPEFAYPLIVGEPCFCPTPGRSCCGISSGPASSTSMARSWRRTACAGRRGRSARSLGQGLRRRFLGQLRRHRPGGLPGRGRRRRLVVLVLTPCAGGSCQPSASQP